MIGDGVDDRCKAEWVETVQGRLGSASALIDRLVAINATATGRARPKPDALTAPRSWWEKALTPLALVGRDRGRANTQGRATRRNLARRGLL